MSKIPATREEAIAAIVEMDVAKWGEAEREPSRQLNSANHPTYGLALNSLAHRPEHDFGVTAPELVAAAKAALTDDDWAVLRRGG